MAIKIKGSVLYIPRGDTASIEITSNETELLKAGVYTFGIKLQATDETYVKSKTITLASPSANLFVDLDTEFTDIPPGNYLYGFRYSSENEVDTLILEKPLVIQRGIVYD